MLPFSLTPAEEARPSVEAGIPYMDASVETAAASSNTLLAACAACAAAADAAAAACAATAVSACTCGLAPLLDGLLEGLADVIPEIEASTEAGLPYMETARSAALGRYEHAVNGCGPASTPAFAPE